MANVTAMFGASLGNLTTNIPFCMDTVFDVAFGIQNCPSGPMYTGCIAVYIGDVTLTAYDITIGQLNYLMFTFGQVVGCLISGNLVQFSRDVWSLFGWGPGTCCGTPPFKFRDVVVGLVVNLISSSVSLHSSSQIQSGSYSRSSESTRNRPGKYRVLCIRLYRRILGVSVQLHQDECRRYLCQSV